MRSGRDKEEIYFSSETLLKNHAADEKPILLLSRNVSDNYAAQSTAKGQQVQKRPFFRYHISNATWKEHNRR